MNSAMLYKGTAAPCLKPYHATEIIRYRSFLPLQNTVSDTGKMRISLQRPFSLLPEYHKSDTIIRTFKFRPEYNSSRFVWVPESRKPN